MSKNKDSPKLTLVITEHARDRYYQRILSGFEPKSKIEQCIKKSWDNAVITGLGEEGRIVWTISKPYECRFITVVESQQNILLTVLWPESFFKEAKLKDCSNKTIYSIHEFQKEIIAIENTLKERSTSRVKKGILKYELDILYTEYYSLYSKQYRHEQNLKLEFYEKAFKMLNKYLNGSPSIGGCKEFVHEIVEQI